MLKDLKEAVRGSAHDYTTGSLGRAVFLLSVPMVLEMVLESVFAVVDIYPSKGKITLRRHTSPFIRGPSNS